MRKKLGWGRTKPSVGYGVDWGDPISRGLVGCWLFNEGAGKKIFDLARNNHGTITGPTWAVGKFGQTLSFSRTSGHNVDVGGAVTYAPLSSPFAISFWMNAGFDSVGQTPWALKSGSTTTLAAFYIDASPGSYSDFTFGVVGSTTNRFSFPTFPGGVWNHVVISYDGGGNLNGAGTNYKAWVNGIAVSVVAGGAFGSFNNTTTTFGEILPAGNPYSGKLEAVRIYNRQLSGAEARRLYTEPFAGIEAPRRRMMRPVIAGGSTYSLVLGQGSYTLTGKPDVLTVQRKLSIAQGSYVLTGKTDGLTVQRKLSLAQGSYTLSGQAVTLSKSSARTLTVGQGSYTVSGQAALFRYFKLALGYGGYVLTGKAVTLTYTPSSVAPFRMALSGKLAAPITLSGVISATFALKGDSGR